MDLGKIFVPYRVIGNICDNIPIQLKYNPRLKRFDIISVISNTLSLYKVKGLRLIATSLPLPKKINIIACNDTYMFASCGYMIYGFNLNHNNKLLEYDITKTISLTSFDLEVVVILPFGAFHIIVVYKSNKIVVWEIHTQIPYTEINFNITDFKVTCVSHPKTYLNKILFGSQQGTMKLWNIKSNQLIYEFVAPIYSKLGHNFKSNVSANKESENFIWGYSAICVIEQTPALDVMGIGFENGTIAIHNIKYDETLFQFNQSWGPVDFLSFRNDDSNQFVSGTRTPTEPHLAIWDLTNKSDDDESSDDNSNHVRPRKNFTGSHALAARFNYVHRDGLVSMKFIPDTPLLVTTGLDNAIKIWNFESRPDGTPNLLHCREGHRSPPIHKIRFLLTYDNEQDDADCQANTEYILSAASDGTLRKFSTIHDGRNKSFGTRYRFKNGILIKATNPNMSSSTKKRAKIITNQNSRHLSTNDHINDAHWLPPIIDFDSRPIRSKQWDDTVCIHEDCPFATTWSTYRNTLGAHVLTCGRPHSKLDILKNMQNTKRKGRGASNCFSIHSMNNVFDTQNRATTCCMSECGNFAFVGHENGRIDKFNVQSGIYRGSFIEPIILTTGSRYKRPLLKNSSISKNSIYPKLNGPVCLLYTDSPNKILITGYQNSPFFANSSLEGNMDSGAQTLKHSKNKIKSIQSHIKLIFWSYKTSHLPCNYRRSHLKGNVFHWTNHNIYKKLYISLPGSPLINHGSLLTRVHAYHKTNLLLALALRDNSVALIDARTQRLVRLFKDAHDAPLTAIGFRKDTCQWLYTAGLDGTFKTWHIATACLLDVLTLNLSHDSPITSFDTSNQYLVTAHANCVSLRLWTNSTLYSNTVDLHPLPTAKHTLGISNDEQNGENAINGKKYVTLSDLPPSYNSTLLNLDALRLRNANSNNSGGSSLLFDRLKQPLDNLTARHLPFFLGQITNQENKFGLDQIKDSHKSGVCDETGKRKKTSDSTLINFANRTAFNALLLDYHDCLTKSLENNDSDLNSKSNELFLKLTHQILEFTPSQADAEIRLLAPENQLFSNSASKNHFDISQTDKNNRDTSNSLDLVPLVAYITFLGAQLATKSCYDNTQTHINLLIKYHFHIISSNYDVLKAFTALCNAHENVWNSLEQQFLSCLQLIDTFKCPVI